MLETIRAYCAERLAEAGETAELRRAHAAYYLDLARTADPHLRRAQQLDWLRRLDAERDNLQAAARSAVAAGDLTMALRLVAALAFYWWLRGLRGEGTALSAELLRALGDQPPPGMAEEYALCVLYASLDNPDAVRQSLPSSETVLAMGHGPLTYPFLLFLSGMAAGPPDRVVAEAEMLEWRSRLGDDRWSHSLAAAGSGLMHLYHGRAEDAEPEFADALDGFRALGDRWGTIMVLSATAELADWRADHGRAEPPMGEALRLAEELGSQVDVADLLRVRGDGRLRAGDVAGAADDYQRSIDEARRAGAPEIAAGGRHGLGQIAQRRGDLDAARALCEAALAECPTGWFGADATRFGILVTLGQLADAAGDTRAARSWFGRALGATSGVWSWPVIADAITGLVGIELRAGAGERAALLLGAATVVLGEAPAEDLRRATRELIGGAAFDAQFARGAALTRVQAAETLSADGA
jgi:tetratricopeptide (TPR) repeat protein